MSESVEKPVVTTAEFDGDAPNTTSVYAHRSPMSESGVSDFIFCSFGQTGIADLEGHGYGSATEWVETHVMLEFDDDDDVLDELIAAEPEREGPPTRVGTLHYDRQEGVVVALELDDSELVDDE